jgi:hypothetical protein
MIDNDELRDEIYRRICEETILQYKKSDSYDIQMKVKNKMELDNKRRIKCNFVDVKRTLQEYFRNS